MHLNASRVLHFMFDRSDRCVKSTFITCIVPFDKIIFQNEVTLRDSKNNVRDVQSLFARQGASICDPRVQATVTLGRSETLNTIQSNAYFANISRHKLLRSYCLVMFQIA